MRLHYIEAAAIIPLGDFVLQDYAWAVAGIFAFTGVIVSFYNIAMHLAHWTRPVYQLWIVRVLFIVPIYASISFISIHEETTGLYMEIVRDCYEAFVIYCFLIWILNVIGGEEACAQSIAARMSMKHPFPLCCLPPLRLNASFLRVCKQMALQFVILKPLLGSTSFLLLIIGGIDLYDNSIWQLIMLTTYNVSYTLALYGLFLFYVATKEEMNSFSPVRKFLAVKSIVFLTYWQALFIPIIFGSEYSDKTNDFVLCVEMVVFAFMQYRAFPWWEFKWRKIPIDQVDYVQFNKEFAIEDIAPSPDGSPRDNDKNKNQNQNQNVNNSSFGYHKYTSNFNNFGGYDSDNDDDDDDDDGIDKVMTRKRSTDEPEIIDYDIGGNLANISVGSNNLNHDVIPRRHRKSSDNLSAITEEVFSMKSWCSAFWEVINLMDVCNDAYYNFLTPKNSNIPMVSITPQRSLEDDNNTTNTTNTNITNKNKNISMINELLLDDNFDLNTQEKRKNEYKKHSGIELITKKSSSSTK